MKQCLFSTLRHLRVEKEESIEAVFKFGCCKHTFSMPEHCLQLSSQVKCIPSRFSGNIQGCLRGRTQGEKVFKSLTAAPELIAESAL